MSKAGRPPMPVERRSVKRVVVRAPDDLADDIRQYAEYRGETVQAITRRWWKLAIDKHPEFRVPQKT